MIIRRNASGLRGTRANGAGRFFANPDDIERKRLQYLRAGAREIWIVYEKAWTMHVFASGAESFLVCDDTSVFDSRPGFSVIVRELFRY